MKSALYLILKQEFYDKLKELAEKQHRTKTAIIEELIKNATL